MKGSGILLVTSQGWGVFAVRRMITAPEAKGRVQGGKLRVITHVKRYNVYT